MAINASCCGPDSNSESDVFFTSDSGPRHLHTMAKATRGEAGPEPRQFRVLLATNSTEVEQVVMPIIRAFDARVVRVNNASDLAKALRERESCDLVLSDGCLSGGTGLGMLASAHQDGHRLPFVIVQSVRQDLVRVVVGGGTRAILAARVVNAATLMELVEALLGRHVAPASTRRSRPAPAPQPFGP